jgi:hypothetical protein
MKYIVSIMLFVLFTVSPVASSERDFKDYYMYGSLEAIQLANKIEGLKVKYNLCYKDKYDLIETCDYIVRYSKFSKFDKYDLSAICLKESKFNSKAYNRTDGGKGLFQITNPHVWWKEELFWFNEPYSKDQSTKAAIIILEKNLKKYKTKNMAIFRYNGKTYKSKMYQRSVMELKQKIKSVKV